MVLALAVLTTLGPAVAARGADLKEVIRTLETPFQADAPAAAAIRDFQGEFSQESRIASLDRVQRGRGRVAVKFKRLQKDRPPLAMFRWEYDQPTNQEIISDGRTMWVYMPENNQVIRSDIDVVNRTDANDPLTFLTGLGNLSRDFNIGWAEPNRDADGNWVLEMTPRRPSPLIARLLIVVDRRAVREFTANGTVDHYLPMLSSTVYDPNGNSTIIEFSDIRVNRGLSDSYFDFSIPAGVDVVRPTGQGMGF
jgi:outer membrane lipoprotein carrier protein